MSIESPGWSPNGVPFCWQPKEAFERIEQSLERGAAASAKLVYLSMTRIASNEESLTFSKPINYIASLSSLERRTVERRLIDLERLGLVHIRRQQIEGSKARDLNRYTLATLCRNLPNLSRKLATAPSSHAVAVKEELKKESVRYTRALKPTSLEECLAVAGRIGLGDQEAKEWFRDCEACNWTRGDGTPFDNWQRQLVIHRDKLRERQHLSNSRSVSRPARTKTDLEVERRKLLADLPFETGEKAAKMRARLNQLNETEATV